MLGAANAQAVGKNILMEKKRFKLHGSIILLALLISLMLIILMLMGLVNFIKDLDILLSESNKNYYSLLSAVLDIITSITLFCIIYQLFDNAFSSEIVIDTEGIRIRTTITEIRFSWDQILCGKEDTIFKVINIQYLVLRQKTQIINKGFLGRILFWVKTETIVYSIFEDEAALIINAALKR